MYGSKVGDMVSLYGFKVGDMVRKYVDGAELSKEIGIVTGLEYDDDHPSEYWTADIVVLWKDHGIRREFPNMLEVINEEG